jgi:hypothetical protein
MSPLRFKVRTFPVKPRAFRIYQWYTSVVTKGLYWGFQVFNQAINRPTKYFEVFLSNYGSKSLADFGRFFNFLIHTQSVGLFGRGISPSQGLYLHNTNTNKRTETFMPRVKFEPTIAVFERVKTVHALDRAATLWSAEVILSIFIKANLLPENHLL